MGTWTVYDNFSSRIDYTSTETLTTTALQLSTEASLPSTTTTTTLPVILPSTGMTRSYLPAFLLYRLKDLRLGSGQFSDYLDEVQQGSKCDTELES